MTAGAPLRPTAASPPTDASPSPSPMDSGSNPALLFSDDFEGSQALPRAWDTILQDDGTLALDTSTSVSASTSLRATALSLPSGAPGNAANITLRKRFAMPAAGETLDYSFQTFLSQSDQNGANAVIGAFQIADAAGDLYEIQLDVRLAGAGVYVVILAEYTGLTDGGSAYIPHPVSASLPGGAWVPVDIQFTASQPPVARLYFNQALALETTADGADQRGCGPALAGAQLRERAIVAVGGELRRRPTTGVSVVEEGHDGDRGKRVPAISNGPAGRGDTSKIEGHGLPRDLQAHPRSGFRRFSSPPRGWDSSPRTPCLQTDEADPRAKMPVRPLVPRFNTMGERKMNLKKLVSTVLAAGLMVGAVACGAAPDGGEPQGQPARAGRDECSRLHRRRPRTPRTPRTRRRSPAACTRTTSSPAAGPTNTCAAASAATTASPSGSIARCASRSGRSSSATEVRNGPRRASPIRVARRASPIRVARRAPSPC